LFAQNISNVTIDVDNYAAEIALSLSQSKPTTMKEVLSNYCESVLDTSLK
jgi:hypothetical protein